MTRKKLQTKKILSKAALSRKGERRLLNDLRTIIEQTRAFVAVTINENLVMLYWNVGARIRTEILEEACRLWRTNCLDTVKTIGCRLREGILSSQSIQDD